MEANTNVNPIANKDYSIPVSFNVKWLISDIEWLFNVVNYDPDEISEVFLWYWVSALNLINEQTVTIEALSSELHLSDWIEKNRIDFELERCKDSLEKLELFLEELVVLLLKHTDNLFISTLLSNIFDQALFHWNMSDTFQWYKNILHYVKKIYISKMYTNNVVIASVQDIYVWNNNSILNSEHSDLIEKKQIENRNLSIIFDDINAIENIVFECYFDRCTDLDFINLIAYIISNSKKKYSKWFDADMSILETYREKLLWYKDRIKSDINDTNYPIKTEGKEGDFSIIHLLEKRLNHIENLELILQLFRFILIFKSWSANVSANFTKSYIDEYYNEFISKSHNFTVFARQSIYNLFWVLFNLTLDTKKANISFDCWLLETQKDDSLDKSSTLNRNKLFYEIVNIASDLQLLYAKLFLASNWHWIDKLSDNSIKFELNKLLQDLEKFSSNIEKNNLILGWLISWSNVSLKEYLWNELYSVLNHDWNSTWLIWNILTALSEKKWQQFDVSESKVIFSSLIYLLILYVKKLYNWLIENFELDWYEKLEIHLWKLEYFIDENTIKIIQSRWTLETDYLIRTYNSIMSLTWWTHFMAVFWFWKVYKDDISSIVENVVRHIPKAHSWWIDFFSFIKIEQYMDKLWLIKFNHKVRLIFWAMDNFDLQYSPWHSKRVAENSRKIWNILVNSEYFLNKYRDDIVSIEREMANLFLSKHYQWVDKIVNKDSSSLFTECLYLSWLLHDAWKIAINPLCLSARIKPSEEEYNDLKLHSERWKMVIETFVWKRAGIPQFLVDWTLHHERPDWRWYPDNLLSDEIPLVSKIISLADTIDAILWKRSYIIRKVSIKMLEDELKKLSWQQFDSDIVNILLSDNSFLNYLLARYQ